MPTRRTKRGEDELPADSYPLRLPADLRAQLDSARRESERSLNSEILFRLRRDLSQEGAAPMVMRQEMTPFKSDKLDQVLMDVVKALSPERQLALLQLLR